MKKLEVSEQFVREAHASACQTWKQRIEEEFPSLFEVKLEVEKWYKLIDEPRFKFQFNGKCGERSHSGFNRIGEWVDMELYVGYDRNYHPCTEEEVKASLVKEAKKLGYKIGNELNRTHFRWNKNKVNIEDDFFNFYGSRLEMGGVAIFEDGQWADIIDPNKEIKETISRLEKELKELKEKVK